MNDRNAQGVSTFDVGYCIGIISGVNDLLAGLHQIDNPDGSTKGQYIRVVTKYLNDHPEELSERDSVLVIKALKAAFPPKAQN